MIETKFKQTEIGLIPEDWNTKTIGEISYFYNGTAHESIVDENGRWILVNSKFISTESEVVKHVSKCLHPCYINDILMVMSDVPNGKAIAKCFIVNEDNKYSLNQRICRFSIFNGNPRFIYYALNRNPYYLSFDDGVKQTNLSKKEVINCPLSFPPLEEQSRIASALTSVDNLLSSIDKLIAKKRDIKQGAMQQLITGKTRLKGFTEPWSRVCLGDILSVGNGRDYKHLKDGNIPVYGTGGIMTYVNDYLYDGETVCIGRKGTIDKPYFHSGKIWTVDTLFYTYNFQNSYPLYLYYKFCLIDWLSYNEATGVPSLSKKIIEGIEITLPQKEEQQAIASVLSSMDNEIAALEAKRKKYEAVKQGMMQQLLTGKIRLINQ